MKIANSYLELIGNTPLLRLNKYEKLIGAKAAIVVKLENLNPLASVKDRLAFALIKVLEEKDLIKEDTVLIEPTSGNTGIGLSFIAAVKGIKLILVMPETATPERKQIMEAFGAEVVLTPKETGMSGSIAYVNQQLEKYPNYINPMQFENEANPAIHRKTTAQEILRDTDGKVDIFVAGVGTGGTITGVGEVLKEYNPNIKIIAVEPSGSPVISTGQKGSHVIQGIGAGFVPKVLNRAILDDVMLVSDEDAIQTARTLAKTEGVFAGYSSGANVYAASQLALKDENTGKVIITTINDTGERYLSTPLYRSDNV